MKALTFIAITLLSGAVAGTILGLINQGVVDEGGNRTDVHDYDGKFIRTDPDGSKVNNLRHLQNC